MLLPEKPETRVLINRREIREAQVSSLWRKTNNAAILEFRIPRRTYLALRDLDKELRQGSIVELYAGIGSAQQRIFYGYLPSILADRNLSENDSIITITAYDFIGQLQDIQVTLDSDTETGTEFVVSSTGTPGGGGPVGPGGSCWSADTLIDTPNGTVPFDSLHVGDYVLTPDGPRLILKIRKTGMHEVIERFHGVWITPLEPFVDEEGTARIMSIQEYEKCPSRYVETFDMVIDGSKCFYANGHLIDPLKT